MLVCKAKNLIFEPQLGISAAGSELIDEVCGTHWDSLAKLTAVRDIVSQSNCVQSSPV